MHVSNVWFMPQQILKLVLVAVLSIYLLKPN